MPQLPQLRQEFFPLQVVYLDNLPQSTSDVVNPNQCKVHIWEGHQLRHMILWKIDIDVKFCSDLELIHPKQTALETHLLIFAVSASINLLA